MFEIFGRNSCSFCDQAKALLEANNIPYMYKNLEGSDISYLPEFKERFPTASTVPQITDLNIIDGVSTPIYVGGASELTEYLKTYGY